MRNCSDTNCEQVNYYLTMWGLDVAQGFQHAAIELCITHLAYAVLLMKRYYSGDVPL